jgi:hypothetical protein
MVLEKTRIFIASGKKRGKYKYSAQRNQDWQSKAGQKPAAIKH